MNLSIKSMRRMRVVGGKRKKTRGGGGPRGEGSTHGRDKRRVHIARIPVKLYHPFTSSLGP